MDELFVKHGPYCLSPLIPDGGTRRDERTNRGGATSRNPALARDSCRSRSQVGWAFLGARGEVQCLRSVPVGVLDLEPTRRCDRACRRNAKLARSCGSNSCSTSNPASVGKRGIDAGGDEAGLIRLVPSANWTILTAELRLKKKPAPALPTSQSDKFGQPSPIRNLGSPRQPAPPTPLNEQTYEALKRRTQAFRVPSRQS